MKRDWLRWRTIPEEANSYPLFASWLGQIGKGFDAGIYLCGPAPRYRIKPISPILDYAALGVKKVIVLGGDSSDPPLRDEGVVHVAATAAGLSCAISAISARRHNAVGAYAGLSALLERRSMSVAAELMADRLARLT